MRISDWSSDVCSSDLKRGEILGVVPKTFLPNYREYHEKRYFASGMNLKGLTIKIGGQEVPFGTDLVFCGDGIEGFTFASSEERRVGKECVSPCRSRGSRYH